MSMNLINGNLHLSNALLLLKSAILPVYGVLHCSPFLHFVIMVCLISATFQEYRLTLVYKVMIHCPQLFAEEYSLSPCLLLPCAIICLCSVQMFLYNDALISYHCTCTEYNCTKPLELQNQKNPTGY